MYFQKLQSALLDRVRQQVRNGELTERRLAKLTGISQPQIHNILKGLRGLTAAKADQILARLRLSMLDLFEYPDVVRYMANRQPEDVANREIPVLAQRLGPALEWPQEVSPYERYPIPCQRLTNVQAPLIARLAEEPRMQEVLNAGDLVLLDHSEETRRRPDPRALYAIEREGKGMLRWVRHGSQYLYLISADSFHNPWGWQRILLARQDPCEVVRARAIPVTRRLQRIWIQREDPVAAMTSR